LTVEGALSEDGVQGEEVRLTLSQALWSRLGSSKLTFTLQDLLEYRGDIEREHERERDLDPDADRLDFSVLIPMNSFVFPKVLTRIKLGPDDERWPRRFFVDLLGLSEKEYQAIKANKPKSKEGLAWMREGIFSEVVFTEAGWERVRKKKLSVKLYQLLAGGPVAQVAPALVKDLKVSEVRTPSRKFVLPSSFVKTKLGSTRKYWCRRFFVDTLRLSEDTYQAIKADKDPGFARVRSTPGSTPTLVIEFGDKGWARVKDTVLTLSLHDLRDASLPAASLAAEEKEQALDLDFVVEARGLGFALPARYVERLGTPKTWARAFLVDEHRFSEQEYQGIKAGKRPELARLMTDPFVVVFGDEGWSKVKDRKVLSLSDLLGQ